MKKVLSATLALIQVLVLFFTALPISAQAAATVEAGTNPRVGGDLTDSVVSSGTCGENLTWTLDHEGLLEISGFGDMADYCGGPPGASPWYQQAESIKAVSLPRELTSIGESAFFDCTNLAGVAIPDGVTEIGFNAFCGCESLVSVTIPASVTKIGNVAFMHCSGLQTVRFTGDAPQFRGEPFNDVTADVYYPADNPTWTADVRKNYGGDLTWIRDKEPTGEILASGICGYDLTWTLNDYYHLVISGTGEMYSYCSVDWPWYDYFSYVKKVTINEGVTGISKNGFYGHRRLESVSLPESLTAIGPNAFHDCENLKEVNIPDSVEVIDINAFQDCTSLERVTVGKGVYTIGEYAFSGCASLKGISVDAENPYFCNDGAGVLFDKGKTQLIQAPGGLSGAYTVPQSVTFIGKQAFIGCGITSVTIPDSVTAMGERAFYRCAELSQVVLSAGLTALEKDVFNDCDSLASVAIPVGVRSIGEYAFSSCDSLSSVTIPGSVQSIADGAFSTCKSLESITIPARVDEIGKYAFGHSGLKEIYFRGNAPEICDYDVFDYVTATAYYPAEDDTWTDEIRFRLGEYSVTWETWDPVASDMDYEEDNGGVVIVNYHGADGELEIPEVIDGKQVTAIGENAFDGNEEIVSVVIPDGITEIGENAFRNCTKLDSVFIGSEAGTGTQAVSHDNAAVTIGGNAFAGCTDLQILFFRGDAPVIDGAAFTGVTATAYYPGDNATWTEAVRRNYGGNITWATVENSYTVVFKDWDETVLATRTYQLGDTIVAPEYPSRAKDDVYTYNFAGWALQEDDKGPSTPMLPLAVSWDLGECTGDATYVAAYTPVYREYTVTFLGCFGLVIDEQKYHWGDTVVPPEAPEKEGQVFMGWDPEITLCQGDASYRALYIIMPEVQWVQLTASLEGNIGLNFYVKLSDVLVNDPSTVMRFTFNGETVDVALADAELRGGQYVFTCPVNAKSMADNVNAQIVTSAGGVGDAKNLAVMTYCNYMIQNSSDADLVKLMKAMLNYGAAAQILFNHNTGNLANASLSEADRQLAAVDASAYAHSVTGSEAGIQVYNATLLLETETTARIYFKLTGSKTIDQYTFKVDGAEVEPKPNGDLYYVEIPNIAAQDLDEMHTVSVGGLTIRYGGLSYVNQVVKNPAYATEAMTNAAKALFAYNKMAEDYFN